MTVTKNEERPNGRSVVRFVLTKEALSRWLAGVNCWVNGKVVSTSQPGVEVGACVTARKGGMDRVVELAGEQPCHLFLECFLVENTNEGTRNGQPWFAVKVYDLAPEPEHHHFSTVCFDKIVEKFAGLSDKDKTDIQIRMLQEGILLGTAPTNEEFRKRCEALTTPKAGRVKELIDRAIEEMMSQIEASVKAGLEAESITDLTPEPPPEPAPKVVLPLNNGNTIAANIASKNGGNGHGVVAMGVTATEMNGSVHEAESTEVIPEEPESLPKPTRRKTAKPKA